MKAQVRDTRLDAIKIIEPQVFTDQRGFFMEAYRADRYAELGLPGRFVQVNQSGSVRNVVRGLHFQWDPPMAKLMRVIEGTAFLVAVDIRHDSSARGQWVGIEASAGNRLQLFAPASFARGFAVLSEFAQIEYLTTGIYNPAGEGGIRWNEPEIGVEWPVDNPILSQKDERAQSLQEWLARDESRLFHL